MATRRKQNIWPFGSRATSPRNVTPASGGIAARAGRPSVSRRAPATRALEWKGFQIVPDGDGFRVPAIDPGSLFDTAADAKRFISDEVKLKRNPGASYRGMSVAKLESIRPHVAVLTVDNDWLVRDRGRRELEKVDHALELARKRERLKNPTWDGRPITAAERAARYAEEEADEAAAQKHAAWVREQQEKRLGRRSNPPKRFYKDVDAHGRERYYHDSNVGRRMVLYSTEEAKLLISTGQATVTPKTTRYGVRANITDRAKRYRAQANVPGPRKCVICGSKGNARKDGGATLDVMHLTGNESHGEKENLAYGCRSCNTTLAHAFKAIGAGRPTRQYNPAAGHVPTFEQYLWAVSNHSRGAHDEGGAVIHATPRRKRIEYAQRIAGFKATRQRAADDERWNPAPDIDHGILSPSGRVSKRFAAASKERARVELFGPAGLAHPRAAQPDARESLLRQAQELRGLASRGMKPRAYVKQAEALEARAARMNPGGAQQAAIWKGSRVVRMFSNDGDWWTGNLYVNNGETITGIRKSGVKRATLEKWAHRELEKANRSNPGRRNPADAAAAGFEMFHGSPSSEVVEVTEQVHYHKHLSSAGELKELQIQAIDGRAVVKLSGFGGSLLTFNEKRNQLFVTGGDQEVDLQAFGINPKRAHELETLGALVSLDYFTDKKHLGSEGGAAIYRHKLRTTNENGRHITVKLARYPDVVYRVPEKRLEFSGGSYEILPEGINL